MATRVLLVTLLSLACFLKHADSVSVTSRSFPHNDAVTGALPKNVKLDELVKTKLGIEAPEDFEAVVLKKKYKFNNRDHLLKALLHESYKAKITKDTRDSYQPLDAIGTMVVDYMFSRHLLLNMDPINGKQLTTMTSAMVKSDTIAFVALKNGFERFINVEPGLLDTKPMKEFRAAVESHELYQDIVQEKALVSERPKPASFLSPMFKAVIGAIYVDSGYSMEITEKAVMPLFKDELDRVLNKVTIRNQRVS